MPVPLDQLTAYCDRLLETERFDDYCPNGLQVEAATSVRRLVTGVTACQALIEAAADTGADALLVHHGFFWKGEPQPLRGMKARRIATLMRRGVSLLAYHLPLDVHPELGNNARLGDLLGFRDMQQAEGDQGLLWHGDTGVPLSLEALAGQVKAVLDREPLVVAGGERPVRRVAWCSGAAQGYIVRAAELGADAYISGEVSEQTVHQARELGIHYLAAGHHATERYGVQALGAHLGGCFGIDHRHIDIDNPV
jgi:dinuclear metal center YbgI/SA1388 family protein